MKNRIIHLAIQGYFGTISLVILALGIYWHEFNKAPDQPINFSHEIHVGRLNLECTFCHTTVDKAIHASVPSVEKCMSCHRGVATDREEIQKLTGYCENEEVIPWEKVHHVADHVYFSHKRHIKAGFDCAQCHGEVAGMAKIRKVRSLQMGFCINCHEANGASRDCYTCHK